MEDDKHTVPVQYKGVMVSSTFTDLEDHRSALIKAINGQNLKSVAMEHDSAKPDGDVIDSSLQMVRDSSAYIGVISHKYGQIPQCAQRNPEGLSLTELEFNEASDLRRPVLLFIMGDDHVVKRADVETDPKKIDKLNAFRENAKRLKRESSVHRVYKVFNDLHEFEVAATQFIADLRRFLDEQDDPLTARKEEPTPAADTAAAEPAPIPRAPNFYAEPAYIGSHDFVGRKAQLETLSDWAAAADPHPVLLYEAIGGAGKSMLTWEWTNQHATDVRSDWAGRFWYSFYERGALMADFCGRALAYITGRPLEDFRTKNTLELGEQLLRHLKERPWLLILDGLERVLVAYHRIDAAQLADEKAGTSDEIANRDPCAAIRPEDDDLLRTLAAAAPSKLLLTSRLIPRVLLNAASQPIPGVLRERLPGLRPADAEALLRSCGVSGTSRDIQDYLKTHCDCHPLVTGVLAGLVNDYLPDRGNFDAWAADPDRGGLLNLADLDLVQKRNHILKTALAALPEKSRQLLSTLALLSEAVDYATLSAFNPYLPPEPERVEEPEKPEDKWDEVWGTFSDEEKEHLQKNFQRKLERRRKGYEQAIKTRLRSPEFLAAPHKLQETVRDLEQRGLLQYDPHAKRYDLHPVVRGVAAGGVRQKEKALHWQRVGRKVSPDTLYITRVEIENIRCFGQVQVNFRSGKGASASLITTILGNNGTGKSTLLRCLALGLCSESDAVSLMKRLPGNMIREGHDEGTIKIELRSMTTRQKCSLTTIIRKHSETEQEIVRQFSRGSFSWQDIFICGYGPHRHATADASFKEYSRQRSVRTLFDDSAVLQNPELTLLRQPKSVQTTLKTILYDTLMLDQYDPNDESGAKRVLIRGPWGRFPIEVLGHGYKSMAQWILDLLAWSIASDRLDDSKTLSGVVLIDEVEQHLHPEWQRHILGVLSRQFPRIQFIVTTHSPLIVSGRPVDQVCRFVDDGDGHITTADLDDDTTFGRADQILTGKGFGLRSTLDELTYRHISEYQRLVESEDSTPEDIHRLNELKAIIGSRIPPHGDTLPERRAQQLIDLLLLEWVGHVDDETSAEISKRAKQLLDAVEGERSAHP